MPSIYCWLGLHLWTCPLRNTAHLSPLCQPGDKHECGFLSSKTIERYTHVALNHLGHANVSRLQQETHALAPHCTALISADRTRSASACRALSCALSCLTDSQWSQKSSWALHSHVGRYPPLSTLFLLCPPVNGFLSCVWTQCKAQRSSVPGRM